MKQVFLHPRFYLAMLATAGILSVIGLGIGSLLIEPPARYYRTTYYSWPIPREWDCDVEGTETVCSPGLEGTGGRPTIIIATAKIRGPMDTYETYRQHLETPQVWTNKTGKQITSTVLYVRETKLGDRVWIDGAHMSSEIENYYTRYLATYSSRLAVLATYAVHKDYMGQYEAILNRSFEQMQLYEPAGP